MTLSCAVRLLLLSKNVSCLGSSWMFLIAFAVSSTVLVLYRDCSRSEPCTAQGWTSAWNGYHLQYYVVLVPGIIHLSPQHTITYIRLLLVPST